MSSKATASTYGGTTAPEWLAAAERNGITPACRGVSLDIFFPESGDGARVHRKVAAARAVCDPCPLYEACREWALEQPPAHLYGIWGGTTWSQRRQLAVGNRGVQPEQFRKANQHKKENAA